MEEFPFFLVMLNGGKLKTEYNVYDEAYGDGNSMFSQRDM